MVHQLSCDAVRPPLRINHNRLDPSGQTVSICSGGRPEIDDSSSTAGDLPSFTVLSYEHLHPVM